MRAEIKSKNKFKIMLQKIFKNNRLPITSGFSINSKNIKKGDIFLPIKGKHFDGHDFIEEAIYNGAALIFSEKHLENKFKVPIIYVDNTLKIIKEIAKKWRQKIECRIIGITGSNGKTSTKEILNQIISKSQKTTCSKENYNSTIGMPISMFSISDKDKLGILEIGANKPGEIRELCQIAKPYYGLVTNISNAHNKYFGSIKNIAKNKISLLESIPKNGYSFINMDDLYLNQLKLKSNMITYGFSDNYDFSGKIVNNTLIINNSEIELPYINTAIAQNCLAAYSISKTIGINDESIIKELEKSSIVPGRGNIVEIKNIKFINDTYNSNLNSCINGIHFAIKLSGNKKILVLGDMHELGNKTESEHVKLGKIINSLKINAVFGLGEYIKHTLKNIKSDKIFVKHCESKKDLVKELENYQQNGDVVYIKGSRSMKMEEIINHERF